MSLVLVQKSGRPPTGALQHVPVGSTHRIWSAVFAGGRAFCADHITASRGLNAQHNRTACRHGAAVPIAAKGEASMHVLLVKPSGPDCRSQDVDGPSGLGLKEDSAGGFEAASARQASEMLADASIVPAFIRLCGATFGHGCAMGLQARSLSILNQQPSA